MLSYPLCLILGSGVLSWPWPWGAWGTQSPCLFSTPRRHQADGADELPAWRTGGRGGSPEPAEQNFPQSAERGVQLRGTAELTELCVVLGVCGHVLRKLSVSAAPGANVQSGWLWTSENQVGMGEPTGDIGCAWVMWRGTRSHFVGMARTRLQSVEITQGERLRLQPCEDMQEVWATPGGGL